MTNIYSKEKLIEKLLAISKRGFVPNARHGNHGGIGNTLEDLLGIAENNLPIANAVEWELKTQRLKTSSLITLFHMEPSPRALHFVPQIFLLNPNARYGDVLLCLEVRKLNAGFSGGFEHRFFFCQVKRKRLDRPFAFSDKKRKPIAMGAVKSAGPF